MGGKLSIDISEEAGVRYLHFGSDWVQGAMRIARPWALELDYTREMMAALLLRPENTWPRKVLQIGLGAASVTKFLYRHRPDCKITVVEIDPAVVPMAMQYFKLPDDPTRIQIEIADGADFVISNKGKYDLILVDGFDADAKAGRLDSLPFYMDCKQRLSKDGLLAVNLLSRSKKFKASVQRLGEAFDGRALAFPSCDSGNAIAFAAGDNVVEMTLTDLKESARLLKAETGLNLLPTISRIESTSYCAGGNFTL
ncbi:MAG: fused MFS/spermidine synthase [Rhodocyclaceae bacterium]|nr:fused MFS/spermidine synthase [Rhodocyclaceae bacterium]